MTDLDVLVRVSDAFLAERPKCQLVPLKGPKRPNIWHFKGACDTFIAI